MARFSICR